MTKTWKKDETYKPKLNSTTVRREICEETGEVRLIERTRNVKVKDNGGKSSFVDGVIQSTFINTGILNMICVGIVYVIYNIAPAYVFFPWYAKKTGIVLSEGTEILVFSFGLISGISWVYGKINPRYEAFVLGISTLLLKLSIWVVLFIASVYMMIN